MRGSTKNQVDDQMVLVSEYYPSIYTQMVMVPEQAGVGEVAKPRRIRKKNKREGNGSGFQKRKLSEEQVNLLEQSFANEHKLDCERKDRLASELGLDPRQVAVWFQNRRARWKCKKLEEEYVKLKNEHDITVIQKCQLQTEVLKLKEKLNYAEKEMKRVLERCDGIWSNSPSSSLSMEMEMEMEMEPPFLGEFGMEGLETIFYLPQNNCIPGLEWLNVI